MNDRINLPILLVEDERPLIEAIKSKLEKAGFNVVSATKVQQAIEYLKDSDFKISAVWLDHYLFGKKDGLDFMSELRNDLELNKIPVYVITNTGGGEKKQSYLKFGANKYYIKSDNRLDDIVMDIKNDLISK
jgi:DNA-binding response OmpR family regulator